MYSTDFYFVQCHLIESSLLSLNVKQIYSCSTEIPETLTLKGLFSGNVIIKMILRWKNVYTMEEKI